jgi:tRNA nucleotidyltransferase (CCA-adding enzyme)
MQIYLVGGAVRDRLRGLEPADRDWCVVGATPEQMVERGYQSVGRDFPVFLHPETREEYALARGPDGQFAPDVGIEDDLARRDLTINAMAIDADQRLIDPFGGQADLQHQCLRHVGEAFGQDPLRVLRVARFAAQLPGFTVAPETLALMCILAARLADVAPERQWVELHKALAAAAPRRLLEVLRETDALRHFLPELDALFGVPQPPRFHPEIDTGEHMLLAMDRVTELSDDPRVRFAVLLHDLGKGVTPEHVLPRHIGHEAAGVPLVEAVCRRLRAPNDYRELAMRVCREHLRCHKVFEMRPARVRELLQAVGAYRQPDALEPFLLACQADAQGRLGMRHQPYPSAELLRAAWAASRDVHGRDFIANGETPGPAIGERVAREQTRRIAGVMAVFKSGGTLA